MNKFISIQQAAEKIQDGMTVMVGGFLGVGNPIALIDALVEKGVKDLTIICNDTAYPEVGVGKLITNHQVKSVIAISITGSCPYPPMSMPLSSDDRSFFIHSSGEREVSTTGLSGLGLLYFASRFCPSCIAVRRIFPFSAISAR